jgi:hypothetical protein
MRDSSKHRDFTCSQFAIILARTGDNVTKFELSPLFKTYGQGGFIQEKKKHHQPG